MNQKNPMVPPTQFSPEFPVDQNQVEALVSTMTVFQTDLLLSFGQEVLGQVAQANETILLQFRQGQIPNSGMVFQELEKILKALDIQILFGEPSFLKKLAFGKKSPDEGLQIFQNLSKDLTRCYVQLKTYEGQVAKYQQYLGELFQKHLESGRVLATYQKALLQGCEELEAVILAEKQSLQTIPPPQQGGKAMDIQTLEQSLGILQRKQHDFHVTEVLFLQTLPVLEGIIQSGQVFLEKLQVSFLVALPVFQQGMTLGVEMKRQRLQGEALDALEAKTQRKVAQGQKDVRSVADLEEEKKTLLRAVGDVVSLEGAWQRALG